MELLKNRIKQEGQNLGRGILKVDGFLNHQVDPALMQAVGQTIADHFAALNVSKVLTAEISGITPAVMTALALGVPVVYARKHKPITMPEKIYIETAPSHTKGHQVNLMVSPEYLRAGERILVVDDFLATGNTILALIRIVKQAEAELVGVGTVIEKAFEAGREKLEAENIPVKSVAIIKQMTETDIIFAEDT